LLLVGVVAYAAVRILALLWLVVTSVVAALLLTALLTPLSTSLANRVPRRVAALLTLLLAVVVLAGFGSVIGLRFAQQLPSLVDQLASSVQRVAGLLTGSDGGARLDQIEASVVDWLRGHGDQLVGYLGTGVTYAVEVLTIVVLTLFVAFFLLSDGPRIWRWLLLPLPPPAAVRADRAGRAAWDTITGYVRGIAVIATIHGIVIGLVVFLLGVPLAVPLGVLVFLGSFVPFVGALVAGGLVVLVTFGTQGWPAALILLGVLVAENQLEAHVLEPFIVGRYVRLHPLAIGLALAVGGVLAGILGAVVAVPVAAVLHRVAPELWPRLGPANTNRVIAAYARRPVGRAGSRRASRSRPAARRLPRRR
jgi:predicted PurR-regulated permease PerM